MRLLTIFLVCAGPVLVSGSQNLASKVVRMPLNQDEPAVVKTGTNGITTLEFPYRIEALDGFGFSLNPAPGGPDLFQISFNKGTNFLSLKAIREGAEGNLTVVVDGKVYSLFCTQDPDPSFVVIFEDNTAKPVSNPRDVLARYKQVSPARLLGFLDKVKAYPTLKVSAPEIFRNMEVAEPNSESSVDGLNVTLRRVIRDDALDSVGFEVEFSNQSGKDFLYDPESLGIRVGEEVYPEAISDAAGAVSAGKTLPAFFVVSGSANGERNDLAVSNKFDIVLRQIVGEPSSKGSAAWQEPPNSVPTADGDGPEPGPPATENSHQTAPAAIAGDKKSKLAHRHRSKQATTSGSDYAAQAAKKERSDKNVGQLGQ
jgi:hypothetical protein